MDKLAQVNLDTIESQGVPGLKFGISGAQTPSRIITSILPYVFGAAGIILLLMLITAGYQYIFSKGDPKAMQIAQSRITSSLIGIVILFTSFWIVKLVGQFLGVAVFTSVIQ